MPDGQVEVLWGALQKAWRRAEFEQLWVQFRPSADGDALADVEAATSAANAASEAAGAGDDAFGEGVSTCDDGPVVLLSRTGPEAAVRAWLDAFAERLAQGWSGEVTAAPTALLPGWVADDPSTPSQLAAFTSWSTADLAPLDEQARRSGWNVPTQVTLEITRTAQRWAAFDGADTYLTRNVFTVKMQRTDVAELLAGAAQRFGLADVTYLRATPRRLAWHRLAPQGLATVGLWNDAMSWQERVDRLRQHLTALPQHADLAFVRRSAPGGDWGSFGSDGVRPPAIRPGQAAGGRHLHDRFVPDAHGIQVLTEAHLAKASDLSRWSVTPLGDGRHLVEAADLEPWFGGDTVDPRALEQARADFGAMVLTGDVVKQNPPPWKRRA